MAVRGRVLMVDPTPLRKPEDAVVVLILVELRFSDSDTAG